MDTAYFLVNNVRISAVQGACIRANKLNKSAEAATLVTISVFTR